MHLPMFDNILIPQYLLMLVFIVVFSSRMWQNPRYLKCNLGIYLNEEVERLKEILKTMYTIKTL